MKTITDEFMMQMMQTAKPYTAVLLKSGPTVDHHDAQSLLWEHVRRNFALHEEGLLSIVCPVSEENNLKGIGIFNADVDQTRIIMEEDPCVKAGIFVFEVYPTRSFPGDYLPK
ncbi:MAG: hypothetical protein PHP53_02035 [Prolixibacteraceae bacterium]|nr:hypothetical protein [Prolixibacteraceae bacterium]